MPSSTPAPNTPTQAPPALPYDHIRPMLDGWKRSLEGRNRAAKTIRIYQYSAHSLLDFLESKGMPQTTTGIAREHVEAFMVDLLGRVSPSTAAKYYRSLQQLFRFLVDDDEMDHSPMAKMQPPKVDETLVPVVPVDSYKMLLATCKGSTFEQRRDTALFTFLYDSGCRISEVAGMRVSDYDPTLRRVTVVGKGNRPRNVGVGNEVTNAFRRYLGWRQRHNAADQTDAFWVGIRGPLGAWGLADILRRRCAEAGLPHMHPHQFRHTFAHNWLVSGGNETDLMSVAGWRSREMVSKYARSAGAERAQVTHRDVSPADRAAADRHR